MDYGHKCKKKKKKGNKGESFRMAHEFEREAETYKLMGTFCKYNFYIIYLFLIFNVYLFLRDRESTSERGTERGRHRIGSRLQALSCQRKARRGAQTHRPRDHDLSRRQMLN